ncbi:MAG TPA: hypothetical protein PLH32_18130 [bacterium]|nr:hypothetical protein [bacterium]
MSRLRELYDAAHPYRAEAPTLTEIMDWAATELYRAQGWRNDGPRFTEEGAEYGDAGDLSDAAVDGERIMADLVAEDMRFAHAQPGALDDCAEVEDRAPRQERIETRLKREGWR